MYFSQHGIPCYALSLHVHGNSWYPSFLRMLYWTTKRMLANGLVTGVGERETRRKGGSGPSRAFKWEGLS